MQVGRLMVALIGGFGVRSLGQAGVHQDEGRDVGNDLVVDYAVLEASATSLARIGREFEDATSQCDHVRGCLGSGALADAMDEFVGNWNRHRQEVVSAIHDLDGATRSVMESFAQADRGLGQGLETRGSTGVVGER
jgi:uncharacterized protein YukE